MGAIVRGFDTREAVREQVQSLGAEFLEVTGVQESGEGGCSYRLNPCTARLNKCNKSSNLAGDHRRWAGSHVVRYHLSNRERCCTHQRLIYSAFSLVFQLCSGLELKWPETSCALILVWSRPFWIFESANVVIERDEGKHVFAIQSVVAVFRFLFFFGFSVRNLSYEHDPDLYAGDSDELVPHLL